MVPRKSSIALSMQRRLCVRLPFVSLGYETHINKRLCRLLSSMNPLNKWMWKNLKEKNVCYEKFKLLTWYCKTSYYWEIRKYIKDIYCHIIINFRMWNIFFRMIKESYIIVWHLQITSPTIGFYLINIKLSTNWIKL